MVGRTAASAHDMLVPGVASVTLVPLSSMAHVSKARRQTSGRRAQPVVLYSVLKTSGVLTSGGLDVVKPWSTGMHGGQKAALTDRRGTDAKPPLQSLGAAVLGNSRGHC